MIVYPDGRKIPFVEKLGVFFVCLHVLPPGATKWEDAFGITFELDKNNSADDKHPGFARPGSSA